MTSDSKNAAGPKKVKAKSKEESIRDLQTQYSNAVESGNKNLQEQIKAILNRLGEPLRVSQLSKALHKRSK